MIVHYLKTAFRNIRKNWVYIILSVCCLAIGTAMFSAFFYGVNYADFFENRLPGHNRSVFVYMESAENLQSESRPPVAYRSQMPYSENYAELMEMPEVEMVSVHSGITESLTFADSTKVYCSSKIECKYVEGDFFRYWNLSLLYGDRMPDKRNEIVVTESLLKRMGYDKDISGCIVTSQNRFDTLQIVNVVRDDRWSRTLCSDVFFSAARLPVNLPLYDIDVVLKEGTDLNEINSRLTSYTLKDLFRSGVMQLTRPNVKPERKIRNALLSFLSIIVLLVAVTNFLKHMIMVLKQRNRANTIRYSLGAGQSSLTLMMMAEVMLILTCSLALAFYLSIYICNWLNQAVYMGDRYFHLADLLQLDTLAVVAVGVVCVTACRIAVYGQNKLIRNRIVADRRESKLLKNIVICVESTVAVFALASIMSIALTAPRPYNPLSKSESRRTFYVETEEGDSWTDNQLSFSKQISQLPQVEDIVPSDREWNGIDGYEYIVGSGDRYLQEDFLVKGYDIRYFSFFNIPIEWLDEVPPSEGYLLDRNTYNRYLENNVDFGSLGLLSGSDKKPIHIAGVYDELMCGNPNVMNGVASMGFRYNANNYFDRNFFIRFHEGVSKSEAETLIRNTWKEVNPSSLEEPKIRPVPKYADEELKLADLGFKAGGLVCILIVILSVSSSISAETNIRRKEVALRKINGAKQKNIMGLFAKPYCIMLAVAFPIGILASMTLIGKTMEIENYLKAYIWIAPLTLITIALIVAISIFRKIRAIMCTNPADVIKSE